MSQQQCGFQIFFGLGYFIISVARAMLYLTGMTASGRRETNELYRQKYFVDARNVLRYRPEPAGPIRSGSTAIIRRNEARLSDIRIPLNKPAPPPDAQMSVQVLRKGATITGIRIQCPCGRHAELDLDLTSRNVE